MPAAIRLVALIARENNPLYVNSFLDPLASLSTKEISAFENEASLRFHLLAHVSLDVFAARLPSKSADSDFGLLFVQDGIAVYGWMTNTGIKIVLGFNSGEVVGSEIRSIFRAIHFAYISLVCNPFYSIDDRHQIKSRKFDASIRRIVEAWNGAPASSIPEVPATPIGSDEIPTAPTISTSPSPQQNKIIMSYAAESRASSPAPAVQISSSAQVSS
ncbi:Sedlin, N-terminal conserved region-domain-containing protein [Lipomyces oligophaga]|uniref:Sedlin, N-terminal conserved region-domain-containing protein n=1 Tax=Lipomyces oligophaga TaxID=45792 RepID=UPI0034CE099B